MKKSVKVTKKTSKNTPNFEMPIMEAKSRKKAISKSKKFKAPMFDDM